MKTVKYIILFSLFLCASFNYGQQKTDTLDLEGFWIESVKPLFEKDTEKIKKIINFPLMGEWGFIMNLNKEPLYWTSKDFFDNYNKLFNKKNLKLLRELNYKDAEVLKGESNSTEIIFSIQWKNDNFESGLIFRYQKYKNIWKLYSIQAVG